MYYLAHIAGFKIMTLAALGAPQRHRSMDLYIQAQAKMEKWQERPLAHDLLYSSISQTWRIKK